MTCHLLNDHRGMLSAERKTAPPHSSAMLLYRWLGVPIDRARGRGPNSDCIPLCPRQRPAVVALPNGRAQPLSDPREEPDRFGAERSQVKFSREPSVPVHNDEHLQSYAKSGTSSFLRDVLVCLDYAECKGQFSNLCSRTRGLDVLSCTAMSILPLFVGKTEHLPVASGFRFILNISNPRLAFFHHFSTSQASPSLTIRGFEP